MTLDQDDIKAIGQEVARLILPYLAGTQLPVVPTEPVMSAKMEIARVRALGIDPVQYLKDKAKQARGKERSNRGRGGR